MFILDIIGDSRAIGLYNQLKPICTSLRRLQYIEEGRLEAISGLVNETITTGSEEPPPDIVIVIGGIFDLLDVKHSPTKVKLRNIDTEYASLTLLDMYEALIESAGTVNANTDIIIPMLYGVNMSKLTKTPNHPHQPVLENIIATVNAELIGLNARSNLHTPFLSRVTSRQHPGRPPSNDYRMLADGCHPDGYAQRRTANLIHASLKKDYNNDLI